MITRKLRRIIKRKDLVLTKVDKGSAVFVVKKATYIKRVEQSFFNNKPNLFRQM